MNEPSAPNPLNKEIGALKKRIQELEAAAAEHKRVEDELRISRQQMRLLMDAGPDFFFLKDRQLRYQLVNVANARFFGRPEAEIIGKSDADLMPPENAAACRKSDLLAMDEKRIVVTVEPVAGRFYETYKFPVLVEGEVVGVAAIIRDITARKQIEESLRDTQVRYRLLFERAPYGVVIVDPPTARFLEFNETAHRQLGYTRAEFAALSIADIEAVETATDTQKRIAKVIREGRDDFETRHRTKDGEIRDIYVTAQMTKLADRAVYHCVWQDITDHKQTLEAFALSKDRLSRAEIISRSGNWEFDMKRGTVFASEGARRIYGLAGGEWSIPEVQQIPLPEYRDLLDGALRGLIRENRPYDVEFKIRRPDTGEILDIHSVAEYDRERGVVFGIIRDVTDRKRLESRLLQAKKLEAIGTLAGGVAHDFNNILMSVQGYVSLLLLEQGLGDSHREQLRLIETQVQSAAGLTGQLLGFARGGRYEIRPADMNEIVKKSSALFARTKKELAIRTIYGKGLPMVEIDRGQIEQALLNLYVNAGQAMPNGGELRIETGLAALEESFTAPRHMPPGNYVRVSVTDTGVGMDEETMKRIFDPFFTTKGMGRGTGLGLAMVYGIVKGHKGAIDVKSDPGRGAVFTLYLPASAKQAVEEKPTVSKTVKGSETILIVDDEPSVLEVSKAILATLGYLVHAAKSGQEALSLLGERKGAIDLVLLDMIMPGLSGSETFDRLRQIDPSVKVLLCSGYSLDSQAQQIIDKGCQGFVQKPFTMAFISRKIREVLERSAPDAASDSLIVE